MSKVKNATVIKYNGITFRSKLEAYCYMSLTKAKIDFEYEKPRFTLMNKFVYPADSWEVNKRKKPYVLENRTNVRAMTYTPDFSNMEDGWVIECKGNPNDAFPLRWKLFKKHLKETKQRIDLYMPTNQKQVDQVIELLKNRR
jgi:hypothetical protein